MNTLTNIYKENCKRLGHMKTKGVFYIGGRGSFIGQQLPGVFRGYPLITPKSGGIIMLHELNTFYAKQINQCEETCKNKR